LISYGALSMALWHDWLAVIQHVLAFFAYDMRLGRGWESFYSL